MSRNLRLSLIAAATVAGVLLAVTLGYAVDRWIHAGQVLRNVGTGPVDLSGLGAGDARRALLALEDALVTQPATFEVSDSSFQLDPAAVGFDVDEEAALSTALRAGREGNILEQYAWWLRHISREDRAPLPTSLDSAALDEIFEDWGDQAIEEPPYPGGITVSEGVVSPDYPRPGLGIDRPAARPLVQSTLEQPDGRSALLPVTMVDPPLTDADVDEAVRQGILLVGGPVMLVDDDPPTEVTFSADQLTSALRSRVAEESEPHLELYFDPERIAEVLQPLRPQLEVEPRDASFMVNDDGTVSVVPGRSGTKVDPETTAQALLAAARTPERRGQFPFQPGAEPDLSTEEAEALGIRHRVSEFTTRHNCCEPRVRNIHLIADIVSGAIVRPGETFSLNDYVGKRTADRGFVNAPVIYAGEYTQDIGGGVSQFATTFYNAVFFAGYEDVKHQPHSYYISRYPEGREATISWPAPDLVFRNDTEAGILIRTSYTDTSITVTFYGDNGGREVDAGLSGRYDFTDPPVDYVGDPSMDPDQEKVLERGAHGWSVTVYRTITYPNGETVEQQWPVRYRPQPRVIRVHPCKIPPGEPNHTGEACPQPTTTTTAAPPSSPPPSDTSAPPSDGGG